jgi:Fe2+ or Zn2+ uptake regulation protein
VTIARQQSEDSTVSADEDLARAAADGGQGGAGSSVGSSAGASMSDNVSAGAGTWTPEGASAGECPSAPNEGLAGETADLVRMLHERGQRVTSQRLVILRELRRRARHATVEEIHRAVHEELPGISVPTVYSVAELLVVGVGCWLYDARTRAHQHVVCRQCGAVEDLDAAIDSGALLTAARDQGFSPECAEVVVRGLCAQCAQREGG